jgi:hypothetical protein
MTMRRFLMGLTLAAAVAETTPALAYNNREHQRFPDQAYQIANILRRGDYLAKKVSALRGASVTPLSTRPASVPASDQAVWDRFLAEARDMPGRMGQIRTGLADPTVPSNKCGNAYPTLAANQHLAQCKALELPFAVKRGWASNTSDCFVRGQYFSGDPDVPEFWNELPTDFTGALLGYYGQNVDDEVRDTIMWIDVYNAGFVGTVQTVVEDVTQFGIAMVFAPIACLIAIFSGSDCLDDAENLAHQLNPVSEIDKDVKEIEKDFEDGTPFANIDGDDLFSTTGLWHFINVEDTSGGDFNRIAGMHYTHGGWRGGANILGVGRIDALDWGIIVGADATGLMIDPDKALGVTRYTQDPDGPITRITNDWLQPIGHIEFEPLDNLALFGWRQFQTQGDASGLGWVLHALGDAVAPHHGIAATGWGHRPYEDFVGFAWHEMLDEGMPEHYDLIQATLEQAFFWWRFIDDYQTAVGPNDINVRDLVTALAFDCRAQSDFALHNGISVGYSDGDESRARDIYGSSAGQILPLLEDGTGATLAFMVKASRLIPNDTSTSPCACDKGSVRQQGVCRPCSANGQVEVDGHCTPTCPSDAPLLEPSGHCTKTCPAGTTCTGVSCPNPSDFVEGGRCVAQCSSANPVVLGRECRSSCPQGMITSDSTPKFCEPNPFCTTKPGTGDTTRFCCPPDERFTVSSTQGGTQTLTCVAQCPQSSPFFIKPAGVNLSPCMTSCPLAFRFVVPQEGPLECLSACPGNLPFNVQGEGAFICLAQCPTFQPFLTGSTCVSECPQSTPFHDGQTHQCVAQCPLQFHLTDGTCVDSCPNGFDRTTFACLPPPQ